MAKAATPTDPSVMLNGADLGGTEVVKSLVDWPLGTELNIDGLNYRRDDETSAVFTGMA